MIKKTISFLLGMFAGVVIVCIVALIEIRFFGPMDFMGTNEFGDTFLVADEENNQFLVTDENKTPLATFKFDASKEVEELELKYCKGSQTIHFVKEDGVWTKMWTDSWEAEIGVDLTETTAN